MARGYMHLAQENLAAQAQACQLDSQAVYTETSTQDPQGSGQCRETTKQQQLLYKPGEPQQSVNETSESQVQHSLVKQLRAPNVTFAADRKTMATAPALASSMQIKQQQHLANQVMIRTDENSFACCWYVDCTMS